MLIRRNMTRMKKMPAFEAGRLVAVVMIVIALGIGWHGWRMQKPGPDGIDASAINPDPVPVEIEFPDDAWHVFQASDGAPEVDDQSGRFRLAGTFFVMPDDQQANVVREQMAILDDLEAKRQSIVSEGDQVSGHVVARIFENRVILRKDGQEIELLLSFKDFPGVEADTGKGMTSREDEEPVLESNRYVHRIGETRWLINKQALVDYYHELLDAPDRIAALYESLRPDYSEEGEILGYILDPVGEQEFYRAVGLQEGDRVRKVNSMNMISQRRAEYFIGEFMQDRLGAVVIDVERGDEMVKLIYLMRDGEGDPGGSTTSSP